MAAELQSTRYDVADTAAAVEFYFDKGWTDGLPVVPPTENAIWGMLESAGLEPQAEITFIDNRQVSVTAEKVAINGVMAGCKPEYMPVLAAAVEGHGRSAVVLSRPGDEHRRLGSVRGGERPHRGRTGPESRRQPVRPRLARQRGHRAGAAAGHAQRHRHPAGAARPQHLGA